jgi:methylated-DNA-[protein]-cysteine S-methyltransferase
MARLGVGVTDAGLAHVSFGASRRDLAAAADRLDASIVIDPVLTDPVTRQLAEYLTERRRAFDLDLDWRLTDGAQRQVLRTLHGSVPFGRTVTYGELARRSGAFSDPADSPENGALGARAVGSIMGSNPLPIVVPCHRVLAADGLGGFGGGIATKRWLLTLEGVLQPTLFDN